MTEGGPDWLERYNGLSVEAAVALAADEGRPVRVLHPGDVVTLEFQPDRVNLQLDNDGALARVTAG